jgi:hypothetical protein
MYQESMNGDGFFPFMSQLAILHVKGNPILGSKNKFETGLWRNPVGEYEHHSDILRSLDWKESTIIYRLDLHRTLWITEHLQRIGVANS